MRDLARTFKASIACVLLAALAACTPRQEGEPIVDVEPERQINTDMTFPKNPHRWGFISTRISYEEDDPFAGYRVVLMNPFGSRLREEGRRANRGIKLAQFVYEPREDATGIAPGELRRVNLLVQDPERYAATGGWGYASFDGGGRPIPIQPATDCVRCHASGPVSAYLARR
jgi:hypothetical protein